MATIYDFIVKDGDGKDVSMKEYKGKVLLIVNTATGCGFTPQYEGLQKLYDKYAEKGFFVLDFPCNQFMNQAPGTQAEITEFCSLHYGTTFPRFEKIKVNGKDAIPLYEYLKDQQKGSFGKKISWNFTKFLVTRDGKVVARFAPTVKPEDIESKIVELL